MTTRRNQIKTKSPSYYLVLCHSTFYAEANELIAPYIDKEFDISSC